VETLRVAPGQGRFPTIALESSALAQLSRVHEPQWEVPMRREKLQSKLPREARAGLVRPWMGGLHARHPNVPWIPAARPIEIQARPRAAAVRVSTVSYATQIGMSKS
jgi:hypothetical protein